MLNKKNYSKKMGGTLDLYILWLRDKFNLTYEVNKPIVKQKQRTSRFIHHYSAAAGKT